MQSVVKGRHHQKSRAPQSRKCPVSEIFIVPKAFTSLAVNIRSAFWQYPGIPVRRYGFVCFWLAQLPKFRASRPVHAKIEESLQLHVIFATSRDHAQNFMTDFASIPQRSNWSICNKRYRKNVCTVSISQNSPQEQDWRECYRNSLASHETGIVWTLRRTAFPQYHQSFLPAEETKANSLRI